MANASGAETLVVTPEQRARTEWAKEINETARQLEERGLFACGINTSTLGDGAKYTVHLRLEDSEDRTLQVAIRNDNSTEEMGMRARIVGAYETVKGQTVFHEEGLVDPDGGYYKKTGGSGAWESQDASVETLLALAGYLQEVQMTETNCKVEFNATAHPPTLIA